MSEEKIIDVVENQEIEAIGNDDDIIDSDNYNTFKLLSLKSKVNDIESIMNNIENEQKRFLGDNEEFDPIDELLKKYTEEELKEMSFEKIDEIFVDGEGNPIEFALDFEGDTKQEKQFKKDFLILRRQSLTTFENFDEELAKINAEIAECQEEFDNAVAQFGNVTNLIRYSLEKRLNETEDEDKKGLFVKLLESFNNGMSLDNVKEYCKTYRGKSIINDFKDDKRAYSTYRRYLRVVQSLDIKTDLTSFTRLEESFLPEEFQKRKNIFMFAVIHYISSWANKNYTKAEGLFITQFTVNLKNLYYDKFDTVEDKETFLNNIKEVITIIG